MGRMALLRADGSGHLGLGNIMRSLALAQGLGRRGLKTVFVLRDYDDRIPQVLRGHVARVETLPPHCSLEEDLALTLGLIQRYDANPIVADLCNPDMLRSPKGYQDYLRGLKATGRYLIALDDVNLMAFPCDMVINPNFGAERKPYQAQKGTRFFLGVNYFLFREEFLKAAQAEREIKAEARNILVTMGGSDHLGLALKVARAVVGPSVAPSLSLRIVTGIGHPQKGELEKIMASFRGRYEIISGSDNMAHLMLWADLAITGGGITKYETALTGTPSIILSQVANQEEVMRDFQRAGSALYLGPGDKVREADIARAVEGLLGDRAARLEMSRRGKALVDGKGTERIISEIPEGVLSPRDQGKLPGRTTCPFAKDLTGSQR